MSHTDHHRSLKIDFKTFGKRAWDGLDGLAECHAGCASTPTFAKIWSGFWHLRMEGYGPWTCASAAVIYFDLFWGMKVHLIILRQSNMAMENPPFLDMFKWFPIFPLKHAFVGAFPLRCLIGGYQLLASPHSPAGHGQDWRACLWRPWASQCLRDSAGMKWCGMIVAVLATFVCNIHTHTYNICTHTYIYTIIYITDHDCTIYIYNYNIDIYIYM